MSATVTIPTQLRSLTGGSGQVQATGATLADIVADLEAKYPGMRERLLDDSGKLRRFVNVYVEDEDVRFIGGLGATIPDGGKVSIIPAVAGGAPEGHLRVQATARL